MSINELVRKLDNKIIVITGATGIVGSTVINTLMSAKFDSKVDFKIVGLARNKAKFDIMFGKYYPIVSYSKYDMLEEINLDVDCPIVIHAASPTDTQFFLKEPEKTLKLTIESVQNILNFSVKKNAECFVYLSSLEVYGEPTVGNEPLKINDYHGLDVLNPRNSYALAKMIGENFVYSCYISEKLPIRILRLSQIIAPPISSDDNRVLVQFAKRVINEEPIVLKTSGATIRNYCDYRELTGALLVSIFNGKPGSVYNVASNKNICSIRGIADIFAEISNGKSLIQVEVENNQNIGYRDGIYLAIDSSPLIDLGWSPQLSMEDSLIHLIRTMKENMNK